MGNCKAAWAQSFTSGLNLPAALAAAALAAADAADAAAQPAHSRMPDRAGGGGTWLLQLRTRQPRR